MELFTPLNGTKTSVSCAALTETIIQPLILSLKPYGAYMNSLLTGWYDFFSVFRKEVSRKKRIHLILELVQ